MDLANRHDEACDDEASATLRTERFGRYLLYPAIAHGGMATVHTARLVGAEGFTRLVAAKRLHPQLTDDPEFVTMFHDEARIASRIHHPNVVPVLDVVRAGTEVILVQEYVHGAPLSQLLKVAHLRGAAMPVHVAVAVLAGVLAGLHAAHEVRDEADAPLEIVHRDVSPQNVMISVDGVPRLLDFGIAKARTSTHHTREGVFKGKLAYMAPEQMRMEKVDRRADVYATGVLAWEMLVNRRIYDGRHELAFVSAVVEGQIPSVTAALEERHASIDDVSWRELEELDAIVARAMCVEASGRYATAEEMLHAIIEVRAPATALEVAAWVRTTAAEFLEQRQRTLAQNEESWRRTSVYGRSATPGSGMRATAPTLDAAQLGATPPDALARLSPVPSAVVRVAPSSLPPPESGAYRAVTSLPPATSSLAPHPSTRPPARSALDLARERLAAPGLWPWVAAGGAFVLVGALLGFVSTPTELPPPAAGTRMASTTREETSFGSAAPAPPVASVTAPSSDVAAAPPAATTSAAAPVVARTHPPVQYVARPSPPPPRVVVTHASPPAAAATATTTPGAAAAAPAASASKADCNPPFYFEGTKKTFKPSCL